VLGFYIAVQSPWNEPANMSLSVDSLVQHQLHDAVMDLKDDDFDKERSAMIAAKMAPFEELSEETSFYWGEIGLRRYSFDHPREDVARLQKLAKSAVQELFSKYIGISPVSARTQLSIWMYPANRSDAAMPPAGTTLPETAGKTITSTESFVKDHPEFWPPLFPWKATTGLPVNPQAKAPPPL